MYWFIPREKPNQDIAGVCDPNCVFIYLNRVFGSELLGELLKLALGPPNNYGIDFFLC
jgi:hypothetical protein